MSLHSLFPVLFYKIGKKRQILRTKRFRQDPVRWTKDTYYKKFHIHLDLENPSTFYEKMNYWKHFSYCKQQDSLTDKLIVKKVLADLGYGNLCSKTLFYSDNVEALEEWVEKHKANLRRFVIKTSHSCGDVFIYDNGTIVKKGGVKIKNFKKVFKMLRVGLKFNHYYSCFEQNYRFLKPMVFVEEFFNYTDGATEYEFMCNYGTIKFAKIVRNRQTKDRLEILVDDRYNVILVEKKPSQLEVPTREKSPNNINFILEFIEKTVKDFPFCRVDFIESSNSLHFSEFTFVRGGGIGSFSSSDLDLKLGNLFKL